jgi:hypothetical protein
MMGHPAKIAIMSWIFVSILGEGLKYVAMRRQSRPSRKRSDATPVASALSILA